MKIDARMKNMLKKFEQSSREYAQVRKNFDFTNQIISILLQNVLLASLFFLLAALLLGTFLQHARAGKSRAQTG